MLQSNTEIVRGFIEAINQNEFDRVYDFCQEDTIFHASPYVGFGIMADDTDGKHFIITGTAPAAPADGVLLPGDELIKVTDGEHVWETFDAVKSSMWGQGIPGVQLTFTVIRGGRTLDLQMVRSRIPGWDQKLSEFLDFWHHNKLKVWPDLKTEIQFIFEKDDLVAFYAIDSGTNLEYHRAAIWGECSIFRVRDGKIVETWGQEDSFAELKQLGYEIREPQREPAV